MSTRKELITAVGQRYREPSKAERIGILDELAQLTGYHRKHAIRVLARAPRAVVDQARARNRLYDEAVRQALIVLWEASDRLCGKRLKALVPMLIDATERHGHLSLDPTVKDKLLRASAATIDRALDAASRHSPLYPLKRGRSCPVVAAAKPAGGYAVATPSAGGI